MPSRRSRPLSAAALAAIVLAVPLLAAPPTPSDDVWHFPDWEDGRHDAFYTEWWYFNLRDARSGVGAIFSYFVTNPLDLGGVGQAQMVAVAYTPEGTLRELDLYPPADFAADTAAPRVGIGPFATAGAAADSAGFSAPESPGAPTATVAPGGTVEVAADGAYRVRGASRDGRLAWDLAYVRAPASPPGEPFPAWHAAERMPVGRLAWEEMSWLVEMPRARVTGTLTLDGRTLAVDAVGYHDHNWGEWVPTDALWNWAQFSSPRLALEVGDFIGKPIGVVALDLDGARTVFTPGQYALVHTRWAWDRVNRLFFPSESILTADDGTTRLKVTLSALATEPLRGDLPAPLRDLIIYEQTARYDGMVWSLSADGAWRVRALVRGTGFKEWTGKK